MLNIASRNFSKFYPKDIVIAGYKRTPIGSLLGGLKSQSATDLGAAATKALLSDLKLSPDKVD